MAKNTPSFQFYPSDFLGGVLLLSDEACGVYVKLLANLWIHANRLPDDVETLAKAAQTTPEVMHRVWPMLEGKFNIDEDGNVMHDRFESMMDLSAIRARCGKMGGRPTVTHRGGEKQNKTKRKSKRQYKTKATPMKTEERRMKNEVLKSEEEDDWDLPDTWDCPEVRQALDDWAEMRRRIRKPIRCRRSTSKIFKRFDSPEHLAAVAEFCEANEYQGLKPEYVRSGGGGQESVGSRSMREQL